jgi:RNA polymerase primary sigma factor
MDQNQQQSQLKLLIAKGKEQGYLTYAEVNDHLPNDIVDPEQIEDIVAMINDMGITVHEIAPDTETILETNATVDEDAAEEAAAALAAWTVNLAALPIRSACICVKWGRSNC